MAKTTWTEPRLARLIEIGLSGVQWEDGVNELHLHAETLRRKWVEMATPQMRQDRAEARLFANVPDPVSEVWPPRTDPTMSADVRFDRPGQVIEETPRRYQRPLPRVETWVPRISTAAWGI